MANVDRRLIADAKLNKFQFNFCFLWMRGPANAKKLLQYSRGGMLG